VTSVAEAQGVVLAACGPVAPRTVPIDQALGLVLAGTVVATHPVPPFTTSAMDGYALVAADTSPEPVRLAVVGHLLAGTAPTTPVGRGQAIRIMTGAPLPDGADAVCMVERTRDEDGGQTVVIDGEVALGTAVRRAGEDVQAGDVVFGEGEVLTPGHVGVLASIGEYEVTVRPRARVGVLSTGDELVEGPAPLVPGKIRDANRHALCARLGADGYEAIDLGIVGDDAAAITTAILEGSGTCDALVTSGGVSVGDVDFVKVVLDELSGGSMRWMQVDVRPARPFAFGVLAANGTPVFGLPGNPVSALVSYELFVRPALRRMGGHQGLERPRVLAVADDELSRRPDGKIHLIRVTAVIHPDGRIHVRQSGAQESHVLSGMARANGLAVVPDGTGVERGGTVEVILTDAGWLSAGARA
jgi:molybdenum cofactor synthesis domain-containing protein